MMQIHDLKNRNCHRIKGFTLVEVIIVLVVLAILAAILIPSLIGYIDNANDKAIIANGSYALKAAQTMASEQYAEEKTPTIADVEAFLNDELPGEITAMSVENGKVSTTAAQPFKYTEGGRTAVFADGKWTVLRESSALTKTKAAFNALADYFKSSPLYEYKSRMDSIALSDPDSYASQFYNSQPNEVKDFLNQGIWMIKDSDEYGVRVFFTTEKYENGTRNITMYKYDPENEMFQKTTKGGIGSDGKISANTSEWSEWSKTMD